MKILGIILLVVTSLAFMAVGCTLYAIQDDPVPAQLVGVCGSLYVAGVAIAFILGRNSRW